MFIPHNKLCNLIQLLYALEIIIVLVRTAVYFFPSENTNLVPLDGIHIVCFIPFQPGVVFAGLCDFFQKRVVLE